MEGYGVGLLLIIEDRRAIARQSGGIGGCVPADADLAAAKD